MEKTSEILILQRGWMYNTEYEGCEGDDKVPIRSC